MFFQVQKLKIFIMPQANDFITAFKKSVDTFFLLSKNQLVREDVNVDNMKFNVSSFRKF